MLNFYECPLFFDGSSKLACLCRKSVNMISLFEHEPPAAAIRNSLHTPKPALSSKLLFSTHNFLASFFCDSLFGLWQFPLTIYQTDQRQNMSEWNIKTTLSSAFLIVRKLTKRQHLHLLTASQRECKKITKAGFYFGLGSFLRFPLHSAHDSCSVTDVICLFHLVTEQGGSTLCSLCPQRLDLTQNIHLCFFRITQVHLAISLCSK